MPMGPRSTSRSVSTLGAIVLAAGVAVASCTTSGGAPSNAHAIAPSGFPLGTYSKEFSDPELGRVRFVWDFEPDGRYAEIPFALDGQTLKAPTVRGTYTVDGETVTIATDFPPDWGTSRHGWRMDGDALWTVFLESDVPEDKDWFEGLDSRPWTPYP
jgi:hypothetical protein